VRSEKIKTTVIEPITNPNLTNEDLATLSRLAKKTRVFDEPDPYLSGT
jgi:hypothetical protein